MQRRHEPLGVIIATCCGLETIIRTTHRRHFPFPGGLSAVASVRHANPASEKGLQLGLRSTKLGGPGHWPSTAECFLQTGLTKAAS